MKKLLAMMTIIQLAAINDASAVDAEAAKRTADRAPGWTSCERFDGPFVVCFATNASSLRRYQDLGAIYDAVTIRAGGRQQIALINVSDRDISSDFTGSALVTFLKELKIATAAERAADFKDSVKAMFKAAPVTGTYVLGTKLDSRASVVRFVKEYEDGRMTYSCGFTGRYTIQTGQNCAIEIGGAK